MAKKKHSPEVWLFASAIVFTLFFKAFGELLAYWGVDAGQFFWVRVLVAFRIATAIPE